MEGASEGVNDSMKSSQKVAGFEYADFEASIAKFDSSFQVCRAPITLLPALAPAASAGPLRRTQCATAGTAYGNAQAKPRGHRLAGWMFPQDTTFASAPCVARVVLQGARGPCLCYSRGPRNASGSGTSAVLQPGGRGGLRSVVLMRACRCDVQVGDIVVGQVVQYEQSGALVDIGGKSSAFLKPEEASMMRVDDLEVCQSILSSSMNPSMWWHLGPAECVSERCGGMFLLRGWSCAHCIFTLYPPDACICGRLRTNIPIVCHDPIHLSMCFGR